MEQNQPKKRGRKKKIRNEEQPLVTPVQEHVEPKVVEKPEVKVTPKIKISKEQITQKLEAAVKELDESLRPEKIADKIQESMLPKVITNTKLEKALDQENKLIYQRVKSGTATEDEFQVWNNKISLEMARKICIVISFLLQNGPLNNVENSILENALDALKSYYEERKVLISMNGEKYLKTTFVPNRNSEVFKFLSEVIKIPFLAEQSDSH